MSTVRPSEDERQVYDPEYHANETMELANHLVKINRALNMFPKTNDRPWNTYFRRPFSGLMNTNIPIFQTPAGRYLLIERVVFGPVAHAITGASGFMINRQDNTFNAMDCVSTAIPVVTVGAEESIAKDIFLNEQETLTYLGIGTAGDVISGCLFGRLIMKDIQEGVDITLPNTEESSPYPLARKH